MTYKEFVECARPELISEKYVGGVYACPFDIHFKNSSKILSFDCHALSDIDERRRHDCYDCWNQAMDANETARAIEIYGSEWYLSALAYLEEKKHDSSI